MPSHAARMSKRLSQAPRLSVVIMAGDEIGERKHSSLKEFCNDHVKTIVTLVMIFGTILCIVLIVMVHKWTYESDLEAQVQACLDVAVIGAGMSGSYASWRMRYEASGSKIHLFEMSNRVGGRLYTRSFAGHFEGQDGGRTAAAAAAAEEEEEEEEAAARDPLTADMGGLYYLPQWHPRLNRSIHALKLKPVELHPRSPDQPTLYLRERHLASTSDPKIDVTSARRMPYNLRYDEQYKTARELKRMYQERALPADFMDRPDDVKFDDVDMHDLGYWTFLNQVASREGINFLYDSSPWRSLVSNGNAALLASLETGVPDDYHTVKGGMDSVPKAFVREFLEASPTHAIHLNMRLACIQNRPGHFRLIFIKTRTDSNDVTEDLSESQSICARKVIMATSPEAVRNVEVIDFAEKPNMSEFIAEHLEAVPAVTAYFLYNQSWWVGASPEYPDAITDLPVRRVRYVGSGRLRAPPSSENDTARNEESGSRSPSYGHLFQVVSADGDDVRYFQTLMQSAVHDGTIRTNCNLSLQAVRDINRQIARIHRVSDWRDIPLPIAVAIKDWGRAPSSGAWHMWKRGTRWSAAAARLAQPYPGEHLYYVGSGFCPGSCQFWAEGALQTVDDLLDRYFAPDDAGTTDTSTGAQDLDQDHVDLDISGDLAASAKSAAYSTAEDDSENANGGF